jgi:hypothetical protein
MHSVPDCVLKNERKQYNHILLELKEHNIDGEEYLHSMSGQIALLTWESEENQKQKALDRCHECIHEQYHPGRLFNILSCQKHSDIPYNCPDFILTVDDITRMYNADLRCKNCKHKLIVNEFEYSCILDRNAFICPGA